MYEKTSDVLHKEMLDEMDAGYQKTIGFPTHDILKAVAVVFAPSGSQRLGLPDLFLVSYYPLISGPEHTE